MTYPREDGASWQPHVREMALFHCFETCQGRFVTPWSGGTSQVVWCSKMHRYEAPTRSVTWVYWYLDTAAGLS